MLRALARLAHAVTNALHGVGIALWTLPPAGTAARQSTVQWWSAKMLRCLGLRLVVQGSFKPGAKLIVANHVSWLDITAVHAVCPQARFVSKADVKAWPLVNRLVGAADTLYIEREKRRDALRVVHQMAEALQAGDTVAVFPEGTTGPGHELLPFHANLLQAAIAAGAPVQPVVLRYGDEQSAFSEAAQYIGDTTLLGSLWKVARGRGLTVHVTVLPPMGTEHADRRRLSEHVRELIAQELAQSR